MRSVLLIGSAGLCASAFAADVTPDLSPRGTMPSEHVAHLYFNLATGERVATLIDDTRPADAGAPSFTLWVADNRLPCADFGQGVGWPTEMGGIDFPGCTSCMPSTATGMVYLDWGDIYSDTVVDCVGITWSSWVQDTDSDGDGIGDGVEGFAGTWAWFDADDGFNSSATRRPLAGFTLLNLPGKTGTFHQYLASTYTATIDLASSVSSSLVFEIGDTDSFSSAPIFNPGAGADLDSDGLADFSYTLRFTQPGTFDFDGDGVPDGDPANQEIAGWLLGLPGGGAIDHGDGTWGFQPDPLPAAQGTEDAFDILYDPDGDGLFESFGTYWYGGFSCDRNGDGIAGDVQSFVQFYMKLYGPGSFVCCPADIFPVSPPGQQVCANGDGLLNFFDVMTFIQMFSAGDSRADIAQPIGQLNFFDVSQFMTDFIGGCP